jgi:hypothetical protein
MLRVGIEPKSLAFGRAKKDLALDLSATVASHPINIFLLYLLLQLYSPFVGRWRLFHFLDPIHSRALGTEISPSLEQDL